MDDDRSLEGHVMRLVSIFIHIPHMSKLVIESAARPYLCAKGSDACALRGGTRTRAGHTLFIWYNKVSPTQPGTVIELSIAKMILTGC